MKNKKLTKIFVAILSLALLVGAAIGITAAADENDTYAIKSINVAHGDTTQILVAVDAPAAEAENIEVKYTFDGKEYTAKYYKNIDIYNNGTEYPVFYTKGIGAKDCGLSVVAEAHKKGTAPASPLYKEISVAEYLFTKLYVEGYISATEGEALDKKNLYVEFIEYISSAEEVLYNYKNPDNKRQLLNTKTFVVAEDAYVAAAGGSAGFVKPGTISVKYTGTAPYHVGWKVDKASGTEIVIGDYILAEESLRVSPYFDKAFTEYQLGFANCNVGDGVKIVGDEETATADGKYWKAKPEVTGTLPEGMGYSISVGTLGEDGWYTLTPGTSSNAQRLPTPNNYATVKADSAGNKFLEVRNNHRDTYAAEKGGARPFGLSFAINDAVENPNVTIFEFDAVFTEASNTIAQIMFLNSKADGTLNYNTIYPYIFANAAKGNDVGSVKFSGNANNKYFATVDQNALVKVRYEYYWEEGEVQIYLNNTYVGSESGFYGKHGKPNCISYGFDSSSPSTVKFYSFLAVNTNKVYNADPSIVLPYQSFEGEAVNDFVAWTCTHKDHAAYEQKDFSFNMLKFYSGIGMNFSGATTPAVLASYANLHGASGEVKTDAKGNSYLWLNSPSRISGRDRAPGLSAAATIIGSGTTYNFDFDVLVEKTGFAMTVYNTAHTMYSQWETVISDGAVLLGAEKVAIANVGEWASLRMVFYCGAEGGCVVELYKKAADGSYTLLSGDLVRNSGSGTSNADALAGGLDPVGISPYSNATICLDNVAMYTTDAVYTPAE